MVSGFKIEESLKPTVTNKDMGTLSPPDKNYLKKLQHMFLSENPKPHHTLTEKIMRGIKKPTKPHNRVHNYSQEQGNNTPRDEQPQKPHMTNSQPGICKEGALYNQHSDSDEVVGNCSDVILYNGAQITEGKSVGLDNREVVELLNNNEDYLEESDRDSLINSEDEMHEMGNNKRVESFRQGRPQLIIRQHALLRESRSDSHLVCSSESLQNRTKKQLFFSRRSGSCRVIRPNKLDKMGLTAVHRASQTGDVVTLKDMISLGGDVNKLTEESQGCTPALVYAASEGHTDCVRMLLLSGADPNASDQWGNTALFKASCYNHFECVRLLLQHGANIELANKWGALPLQYASIQGYDYVIQLLLQYGAASVSHCHGDKTLPPPVIGAATRCHLKSLKLLLSSLKTDSKELESSLTMALYYFLCSCAGFEYATTMASVNDRFSCIKLLVSHGAAIKPEHLKMCCYHHFIPLLNLESYIEMLKFLLQSLCFDPKSTQWNNAMMVIFGHVTRLGPHKWDLIRLICSVGFTPNLDLLDSLKFTLTTEEYRQLCDLRKQPRSLLDLSRAVLRDACKSNVVHSMDSLELPQVIQDIITVDSGYFMSL